jgi:hypothetical protein
MVKTKITPKTDNSGWIEPKKKLRKRRKPMTEKQRHAAAERLKKARAVRAEKNPDYGLSGVHESIRDLPDEHPIAPKKVKQWIKTQKDFVAAERSAVKQKVKGSLAKQLYHEGYIKQMQTYLKTGNWVDMFYGEHQQNKVQYRCSSLAYDKDGEPKRSIGTFYPDMGCMYTQEMFNESKGIFNDRPRKQRTKRKNNSGSVAKIKKKSSSS